MANTVTGGDLVTEVKKFLGDKYVYSAAGPSTFDCSGLMQYTYGQLGITIPRTSEEQYSASERIKEGDLQPGDLVFSEMASGGPGHVGMYVGKFTVDPRDGKSLGGIPTPFVIEAPHSGDVVKYQPLSVFGPVAFGRVKNINQPGSPTVNPPGTTNVLGNLLSNLIGFPQQILDAAKKATDNSAQALKWFDGFFQPSTYVRLGAGAIGTVFLVAGLAMLLMAETEPS